MMKKLFTAISLFSLIMFAQAQNVFTENFNSTTGQALPTGWTQFNGDNLTPNSSLSAYSFGTNAWVSYAGSWGQTSTNRMVVSTSWYNPVGAANDWLISKSITLTANNVLSWKAKAPDAQNRDGYTVKISTTNNNVMSFTTTLKTVTQEATSWTNQYVDLSAYAGQTVYIAWTNNSNDKFVLGIDDVSVDVYPNNDANLATLAPASTSPAAYVAAGSTVSFTGSITNMGLTPITTMTLKYNNGTTTVSDVKTGLNIAPFASYNYTHATPYTVTAGGHNMKVWVELTGDNVHTNDTLTTKVNGYSFAPTHNVVLEEGTGTWCGWCPRGAVYMDSIAKVKTDVVVIAVHNADPMTVTAYDAGIGTFISGYPSMLVDRLVDADPSAAFAEHTAKKPNFAFADLTISATYDPTDDSITVPVAARFGIALNGDYRLALVITEDSVTGTGSGWGQTNYYSSSSQNLPLVGSGLNWQAQPNPVPASLMEYNHVARDIYGGFNGQTGSLPGTIADGSTQNYTFKISLAGKTWDVNHLEAAVLLINAATGIVHNGVQIPVSIVSRNENLLMGIDNFYIAPNPVKESINLNFNLANATSMKVTVTDLMGKVFTTQSQDMLSAGMNQVSVDASRLSSGVYIVTLETEKGSTSLRFLK
jgi:hypothetical protein